MTNMFQYFWLWLTVVFGSGFEVEQKFKFSELQRNLGCWRNPEQSHDLPLATSNADTPFILLTREPEGRGEPVWVSFSQEKEVQESSDSSSAVLLELVTCVEWLVLSGSWCDSPGEALFLHQMVWISPGVRRKPVTYCHEAINQWQITRATVKDVKPAAAFCTPSDFYDISPPFSVIIWNGSKTFHRAAVSRACGCETAAALDEWPGAVVQTDGQRLEEFFFDSTSKQILEAQRGSIDARRATSRCSR